MCVSGVNMTPMSVSGGNHDPMGVSGVNMTPMGVSRVTMTQWGLWGKHDPNGGLWGKQSVSRVNIHTVYVLKLKVSTLGVVEMDTTNLTHSCVCGVDLVHLSDSVDNMGTKCASLNIDNTDTSSVKELIWFPCLWVSSTVSLRLTKATGCVFGSKLTLWHLKSLEMITGTECVSGVDMSTLGVQGLT